MRANASRSGAAIAIARAVGSMPLAVRTNNSSCKVSHSRVSAWLTADWLRCSRLPARSRQAVFEHRAEYAQQIQVDLLRIHRRFQSG